MTQLPIIERASAGCEGVPAESSANTTGKKVKGRYAFVSLGCPKNLVDSERMLGLLQLDGYQLVADPDGTDFVVVNTCGFVEQARAESYSTIREMSQLKRKGRTRGLIVSGCLAERQKEQLLVECPDIDHLVGVFGREEVTRVADRLVGHLDDQRSVFRPAPIRALPDTNRLRVTPRHFAYLKISEGCDRLCTFCSIPMMRGKHASKPIEGIIAEARELVADGARELIIVAQDTTYYGIDLYGRPRLRDLLLELEQVEGVDWIRLMYFYPMYIDAPLAEVIGKSKKILPYIDMPLQHINNEMLRRMSRRVTREQTIELIGLLRHHIPNLVLRTTLITGFPGEREDQFEELLEFVEQQRFEHLGVFSYSREPNTPADRLEGHLKEKIKERRREQIMAVQQKIAFEWIASRIGQTVDVLLDKAVPDQDGVFIGRTAADAPDVDGLVYVTGDGLQPGQIVRCEVVASQDYDLIAAPL
ncbi:MAG: 30S ribosomal protein S12 methylthiotransferase RimO [Planctomycetota bacterium]|nr:30S ribosomal protein S12 methylthiotransferase RimO [Planctomycetota bacterium]MDA1178442.1 30S ribosomal protein S12 methylthiotransferase RimO [Planctomycetota bacterium]